MNRRSFVGVLLALSVPGVTGAQSRRDATLYKNPGCGCCHEHAAYLRSNGYRVKEVETERLDDMRRRHGVPEELYGCHLIVVGGYVVEGHVSAPIIDRLLRERPSLVGISLPGMPTGSPGMTGPKMEPFRIYEISRRPSGRARVFALE